MSNEHTIQAGIPISTSITAGGDQQQHAEATVTSTSTSARHPNAPRGQDTLPAAVKARQTSGNGCRSRSRCTSPERLEAAVIDDVNIYVSDPDEAIARLAQLDSAKRPSGRVLVAAVAGEPLAAVPLQGGPAIANPFRRTAELVCLLEMRVAHLNAGASATRGAGFGRFLRALYTPRTVRRTSSRTDALPLPNCSR